jgi:Mce-associated membrane protein
VSLKQPRGTGTAGSSPRRRPRVAGEARRPAEQTASAAQVPSGSAPSTAAAPRRADAIGATVTSEAPTTRRSTLLHPPRRTRRWLWPATGLAVAALAFGVVANVERARHDRSASVQADAAEAAASAAASAAQTILSYSYTSVSDDLAAAQKAMTPAFAKKFADVIPTVESLAAQRQLVVTASVRNTAVLDCGEDCSPHRARVLLFVDQARTGAGKALDPIVVRTVLTMTERDGHWLVSDSVSL